MKIIERNKCHLILIINHHSGVYDLCAGNEETREKWCFPLLGNIYSLNRLIASTSVTGCVMRAGFNIDGNACSWRNCGFN